MWNKSRRHKVVLWLVLATVLIVLGTTYAEEMGQKTSYAPVALTKSFAAVMAQMKAAKPEVMKRHMDLLSERYDLDNRPAASPFSKVCGQSSLPV
jgi:hypothetical protein